MSGQSHDRRITATIWRMLGAAAAFAIVCGTIQAVPRQQQEFDYVLRRTPSREAGARLFTKSCAACHGPAGAGATDALVPSIAGQHYLVLAKQLVDFRHEARRDHQMQHFANRSTLAFSQQIADVSLYVSCLAPRRGVRALQPLLMQRGAELYARSCQRCHQANGAGKGTWLVPRLAGQLPEFVIRQLQMRADYSRPAMTRAHEGLALPWPGDDAGAVASFLEQANPADAAKSCAPHS